jgi:dihydropteroate synthase
VARVAIEQLGVDIINDISGTNLDPQMADTVAALRCPYILMHMRGTPATMQTLTEYNDVTTDVLAELGERVQKLAMMGVNDIIIDPGFGFSKTLDQNYTLMRNLKTFELFHRPLLVGISRKSMLTRLLDIDTAEALNATTALNTMALERGASILRVHDVAAARQAVTIYNKLITA